MATYTKKLGGWQAQVRKKGYKQQTKTFSKKALAIRWANQVEEDMEAGEFKDVRKAAKVTINNGLDRYVLEVLPTRNDKGEVEKSKVGIIRRRFGDYTLATLTVELIDDFIMERKRHVANDTVIKDLAVIHDLYETARIVWEIPCINPMIEVRAKLKKLKSLQPSKGRDRRLSGDEYEQLVSAKPRYKTSQRGKLIAFAVKTAMRREEIARMMWADINKKERTLHIPKAKHGPRTIPLTADALAILESLPRRIDGQVWGMKKKSISRAFERLVESLSLNDLHFHDLRHEGTSRLFEKGLSIPEVQLITGHGDWRSLQRYTKLKAADVGDKLDALSGGPVGVDERGNVTKIS